MRDTEYMKNTKSKKQSKKPTKIQIYQKWVRRHRALHEALTNNGKITQQVFHDRNLDSRELMQEFLRDLEKLIQPKGRG